MAGRLFRSVQVLDCKLDLVQFLTLMISRALYDVARSFARCIEVWSWYCKLTTSGHWTGVLGHTPYLCCQTLRAEQENDTQTTAGTQRKQSKLIHRQGQKKKKKR